MNAIIASHATRHGAAQAIRVGLAAPLVDTLYLLVVTFGLARAVRLEPFQAPLALGGALLMAVLAWQTTRGSLRPQANLPGFTAMTVLSLTNPYQIGWWLTAGVGFLLVEGLPGAVGFVVGIFGWVFIFATAMAHGARRWNWFEPLTQIVSANLLLGFALLMALRGLSGL